MVISTVPPWVLSKTKIYSTICHENSSNSAIFGTFGPFFDIFGPIWPIFDLLMTGWGIILDKLSVFLWDLTILIDFRQFHHFPVPKIAKIDEILTKFDEFSPSPGPFFPTNGSLYMSIWGKIWNFALFWMYFISILSIF